ncbi:Transmembrane protein of unknown function [Micromonospora pattaloongensis]|uniref:DUF3566 domain-containing protein n=1 Tax=Micromonospora pattaloongensis TaxID=405436 RepID=A0A1H3HWW4_9ACTN|nr:DUF3566 domain-containing protein [Micromonospora pattaloongensis]SDY19957.1 Transmembrane protein of unknown function [Micromonospora pattaloongensis]
MTETQAQSGASGTSTTPVDEEAADAGTAATGRAAVGRAAVPADAPSPKFTRAPGMTPPPDQPPAEGESKAAGAKKQTGTKSPVAVAAPVVTDLPGSAQGGTKAGSDGGSASPDGPRPVATGPGRAAAGASAVRTVGQAVGAARVTEAVRAARSTVSSAAARGPRRARLNVKRIDPWSVMKFSFAVSLVLFIVVIVATSVLYLALDAMGVFKSVNGSLTDLISAGGSSGGGFKITAKGVIGTAALVGLVNVVLFTALATLGAFIYNVCADLVGGIELTLAERD